MTSDQIKLMSRLLETIQPLVQIADAYDDNALDAEARKYWGRFMEHANDRDPKDIILYQGRGGRELLTLQDCLDARNIAVELINAASENVRVAPKHE
jgi:hypothetical protein